jgi:hypothetical protein
MDEGRDVEGIAEIESAAVLARKLNVYLATISRNESQV